MAEAKGVSMTSKEAIDYAYKQGAQMVDLKFSDMLGAWQHLTIPLHTLKTDVFEEGVGFDGSSCRGWRAINESDMVLMPDPKSAVMDPFSKLPTVSFICDVVMPETLTPYDRDPRQIAKKALAYLNSTGIADTAILDQKLSFLFLMMCALAKTSTVVFIKSIRMLALGIVVAMKAVTTSLISLVIKKATLHLCPQTVFMIFATKFV